MHVGLVMECDYRYGTTQEIAFDEAFEIADMADEYGLDGIWLAERHFAAPRGPTDVTGAGIPSVVSVPLVLASAIAARTKRVRIGTGVSVLPLCHPIRLAEEAATVDHVSRGRLDFGVGRSGFPRSYQGYGIPYAESRERFQESLEVILKAWNNDRFSHEGKYYNFDNVCVIPKPYQKPHPPVRVAATTKDTFPIVGKSGHSLVTGLRGFSVPEVEEHLKLYRKARNKAGYEGKGDVYLRIPVYVADTDKAGRDNPEAGVMQNFKRLAENFAQSARQSGVSASEERVERAERLNNITYDDLLRDRLAYGSPETVVKKLKHLIDTLGLSGVIMESNVGGAVSPEQVLHSIQLYAQEVAPALR